MDIKIVDNDKKHFKMSFILNKSTPAFANTLRRNIINLVPTMAIEDVEFKNNSSVLYDEVIAHRLGLIPLTTDLKSYNLPSECKCEGKGCARCSVKLTLSAKGPKTVYASEFKSKDPKIKPVFDETVIVKLIKGQEIELEATAVLGVGQEHSKWCPGLVHFKNKPIIDISKSVDNAQEIADICPKNIFNVKGGKLEVNEKNILDCHLCEACADIAKGSIKLGHSDEEFLILVESWGQLSCKEMVIKAFDIFNNQVDQFESKIKELA